MRFCAPQRTGNILYTRYGPSFADYTIALHLNSRAVLPKEGVALTPSGCHVLVQRSFRQLFWFICVG